jgi:hypothetical protein
VTRVGAAPGISRCWRVAAWALCVVGAAWRITAYAQNRSLWYDEAALALNIAGRGFVELVEPLDYLQTAPPLFLWIERSIVLLFGASEWALRALPLAAGLATAPLMWRVACRILPAPAAVLAVALVALSPTLVRYSAEVKPYATDALVTLLVLDTTVRVTDDPSRSHRWRALGLVGLAAIVASTPSVFVLAGVIAYLTTGALLSSDALLGRRTASLAAGWAALFIVLLLTVVSTAVERQRSNREVHALVLGGELPDDRASRTGCQGLRAAVGSAQQHLSRCRCGSGRDERVLLLAAIVGLAALVASRNDAAGRVADGSGSRPRGGVDAAPLSNRGAAHPVRRAAHGVADCRVATCPDTSASAVAQSRDRRSHHGAVVRGGAQSGQSRSAPLKRWATGES